jgi:hypothetical protein
VLVCRSATSSLPAWRPPLRRGSPRPCSAERRGEKTPAVFGGAAGFPVLLPRTCSPRDKSPGLEYLVSSQAPHKAGLLGIHPFQLSETKEPCVEQGLGMNELFQRRVSTRCCKLREASYSPGHPGFVGGY